MGGFQNYRQGSNAGPAKTVIASAALVRAVREMREAEAREDFEDAEIVRSGGECWLGLRRIAPATLDEGLRLCIFRSDGIGTRCERHVLNEDGRALADDPGHYIPRILRLAKP